MNILHDNRIVERSKGNAENTETTQSVSTAASVSRRALCGRAVTVALSLVCGSDGGRKQNDRECSYQDHSEESWRTAWGEAE
ncbi:MAG: hypothetical protein H7145_00955 [Akkermansiaceae bacterium]|nr:hypothetical protein [Armatimonadota bacterium]